MHRRRLAALVLVCLSCSDRPRGSGDDDDEDTACDLDGDCPEVLCECNGTSQWARSCVDERCESASSVCSKLGCAPSAPASSGAGAASSASVGAGAGMPSGSVGSVGAGAGGPAGTGAGTGVGAGPGDQHLPECIAYANHVCAICYNACPSDTYEQIADTCDLGYDDCPALFNCMTSASSCEAANQCQCS